MKITGLRVLQMAAEPRGPDWNWTFVRIDTDEGIHGFGEASLQFKDAALRAELEDFGRFLIGHDPFQIELIWNTLHRRVTWTGGPVTMSAISGIDLALWDIKGKALGVPVYELLGGMCRDRVRAYANGWFQATETPEEFARSAEPDRYAELARRTVEAGYGGLKLYPFAAAQSITRRDQQTAIELVSAVRDAVGPDIEIAVDARAKLNMWSAQQVAQKLEPLEIAWLEEPILFDNVEAMAELARTTAVPIATGEQLYTRWEFRRLLESNAARIIQPDICHAGGMSELRKIASAAETYYVMVSPHNSNGPISTVASLHFDTCVPNILMQEIFVNYLPLYEEVLGQPLEHEGGYFRAPDGPGWGVDIDEGVIAAHPPSSYSPVMRGIEYY